MSHPSFIWKCYHRYPKTMLAVSALLWMVLIGASLWYLYVGIIGQRWLLVGVVIAFWTVLVMTVRLMAIS